MNTGQTKAVVNCANHTAIGWRHLPERISHFDWFHGDAEACCRSSHDVDDDDSRKYSRWRDPINQHEYKEDDKGKNW